MKTATKYSPEARERAVRMVLDQMQTHRHTMPKLMRLSLNPGHRCAGLVHGGRQAPSATLAPCPTSSTTWGAASVVKRWAYSGVCSAV